MSEIEQKNEPITEVIVEKVSDVQATNEQVPLEKEAKPKKPRTEKQMEAFKRTQQKRIENIALKKSQPKEVVQPASVPQPVPLPVPQPLTHPDNDSSDSESDEEIVVRRKPKKVVKKKKQIVIELSDSDSDSDSEESVKSKEPVKVAPKQRVKFESQQHKKYAKSNVDVDKKQNFFCD
jgi:hypothetical protein